MKFLHLTAAFAAITLSVTALGQDAKSTTSSKSLYQRLKDSPVSMQMLSTAEFNRNRSDNGRATGYTFRNSHRIGYRISKKDSIRLENRVSTSKNFGEKMDHTYDRVQLRYRRGGILNQKDHGVNMSATLEKRFRPDHDQRIALNRYGLNRASVSLSRSLDNGISLSGSLLADYIDRIKKGVATSTSHQYILLLTQAYNLTDKLSVSFTQVGYNGHRKNNGEFNSDGERITEIFDLTGYLELGYQVTSFMSATLGAEIPITRGHDGERNDGNFFVKNLQDEVAFYGNVFISAF